MGLDWDTVVNVKSSRCVRTADSLDEGVGTDGIIIEFSKAFD